MVRENFLLYIASGPVTDNKLMQIVSLTYEDRPIGITFTLAPLKRVLNHFN